MSLTIEYLNKKQLKPYAKNAKEHNQEQIEQIKKSIQQFGFNDPIAVWKDNEVIEGHGRLLAVMELDDFDTVPVIRLDNLTLTMNTDFDYEKLVDELEDILDIDMPEFGFDLPNFEDAFDGDDEELPEDMEAPEGFKEFGEDMETKHRCPKCGYEWN